MSIDDIDGRLHPPSKIVRDDAGGARVRDRSRHASGKASETAGGNGNVRASGAVTPSFSAAAEPAQGWPSDAGSGHEPLAEAGDSGVERSAEGSKGGSGPRRPAATGVQRPHAADPHAPAGTDRLSKRQKRRRRKGAGAGTGPASASSAEAHSADVTARLGPAVSADAAQKPKRRRRRGAARAALPATSPSPAVTNVTPAVAVHRTAPVLPAPSQEASPALQVGEDRARPPVYAALDLGTNNCRLLVAVPTRPGQFRVIDAFSRIVRLGEGLSRTGRLAAPAMDRAIAALTICSQKLSARSVAGARLIATEACRAAANGEEFIERVRVETGLDLEIVSRETEARLAVSGCGSLVDRSAKGAVLFDIGGGSSEIALLDLRGGYTRRLSNHIVAWTSLPVGVVTLAERHGGRDVTPELFEAMIEEVVGRIEGFAGRDKLGDLVGGEHFHLLGTSGTVTTLAGVHLDLERYDRRQVDGLWLSDEETTELVARIAGWSFEERVANPCIGSDRADLVLAGCAILEAIRRVWPSRKLRVADRGLREGLLTEMMVADGVWRRTGQAQASSRQRTLA